MVEAPLLTVVIAEDDRATRSLLARALRGEGLAVRQAADGEELVALASAAPWPHLVVTDLDMPRLDGIEAVRRLRALGMACPVLVATSFAGPDVYAAAAAITDCEVMPKPLDLAAFRARVRARVG